MKLGSDEWLDRLVELAGPEPVAGTFTGRVAHQVAGPPEGTTAFTLAFDGGRLVAGEPVSGEDAEVSLSLTRADAAAVLQGELDLNAAYMQGQMKVSGPTGPLLSFLAAARTDGYRALLAAVAEETD